jgi:hypothetical protein
VYVESWEAFVQRGNDPQLIMNNTNSEEISPRKADEVFEVPLGSAEPTEIQEV